MMMLMGTALKDDPPSDDSSNDNNSNSSSINNIIHANTEILRSPRLSADGGSVRAPGTNGSIHGGSRASGSDQEKPDSATMCSTRTEEHWRISTSGEERIDQVLIQKCSVIAQRNEGLEKLGAYVLLADEIDSRSACSSQDSAQSILSNTMTQADEDSSLHLSPVSIVASPSCSCTGSSQLARWMTEVNIAVGREEEEEEAIPPSLQISTEEEVVEPSIVMSENVNVVSALALPLRVTQNNDQSARGAPQQTSTSPLSPRKNDHNKQDTDLSSFIKATWQQQHNGPLNQEYSKMVAFHGVDASMMKKQAPSERLTASIRTPKTNNSKVIMASIEGKYKSLRDNLVAELSIEEAEEEEELCPSAPQPPQQKKGIGNPVRKMVSAVISSRNALRDYNVRDHLYLGMLSTHSSGILQSNSWSTVDSFESDQSASGGKGCSIGGIGGKGCGIFLCD